MAGGAGCSAVLVGYYRDDRNVGAVDANGGADNLIHKGVSKVEQKLNPDWEQRMAQWSEDDIWIGVMVGFDNQLSERESDRLRPKLNMVRRAAKKLVLNMVKGTVKYNTDGRSAKEWMAFAIDDATDTLNYLHLMKDCIAMDAVQLPLPIETRA